MAYADVAGVQALLPQRRFGPDTEPTIDQVLRFCAAASAELDAILLDKGLQAPVVQAASPVAWAWLQQAAEYGAAMRAEAGGAAGQQQQPGQNPRITLLERMWLAAKADLAEDRVALTDATPAADTGGGGAARANMPRATAWFRTGVTWDDCGGW